MALSGLDATIADALIGIDTVWGGDVMNPSGTGRFIADCWFSDEPLPRAYTHPAAAALRANGGVGAEKPDAASLSAYLAKVDVKGAIQLVLASSQEIGGLRGAHLEGLGLCCEVMLALAMEIVGQGPAGALRALRADDHGRTARAVPPGRETASSRGAAFGSRVSSGERGVAARVSGRLAFRAPRAEGIDCDTRRRVHRSLRRALRKAPGPVPPCRACPRCRAPTCGSCRSRTRGSPAP